MSLLYRRVPLHVFIFSLILVSIVVGYLGMITGSQNCVGPSSVISVQQNVSLQMLEQPESTNSSSAASLVNEFTYVEPGKAGEGTAQQEWDRMFLFLSTRGAVCQNLNHFGGVPNSKYPFDPDGLWYICLDRNVQLTPGKCIVYSMGIGHEWSFDEAIAKYGCKVYAFDPTMDKPDHFHTPEIQFFNLGISHEDSEANPGKTGKDGWKTRKLRTLIKDLDHENRLVDIIKMDIEWDEWTSLPQMMADGTLKKYVKLLAVEFHVDYKAENCRRSFGIVRWLDRQGFKIINMRKNRPCSMCFEVSYININLVDLPVYQTDF